MIKWILGAVLVIVLALAGSCFIGYKRLTAGGDSIAITMAGSQEAVFAQVATPDSMAHWVTSSKIVGPFGRGILAVGDTLLMNGQMGASVSTSDSGDVKISRGTLWVVREVNAPMLLVTEMRVDSAGTSRVMLVRRDSLVAAGDSTTMISSFAAPLFDAITSSAADSSKIGGSILEMSTKLMVSALRASVEGDLKQLKARMEGTTPR